VENDELSLQQLINQLTMTQPSNWYIIQRQTGECDIVPNDESNEHEPDEHESDEHESGERLSSHDEQGKEKPQTWGPFSSQEEAIARRVGLIRAGKCKPFMS